MNGLVDLDGLAGEIVRGFDAMPAQIRAAARYVLENPRDVALLSMREQARRAGVQPATMMRLARQLGFDGYEALRELHADTLREVPTGFAGKAGDHLASPKLSFILGPWAKTEYFLNWGEGFHSNDARGTTIRRDPSTDEPVDPVTPLVRARGAEVGVRSVTAPHLQTSLTLWTLSLASELVFSGDAGTTEASRPSHRYGVEFANYYSPKPWLIFDGDVSWSSAHFTDVDPVGTYIPGSVATVVSGGITLDSLHNIFGSLRLRYFGLWVLIEDDSVRSKATSLLNVEAGYKLSRHVKLVLDVFNLLDAKASDVDYFYRSRLPGEPLTGIDDLHLHPTLPRTARVNLLLAF